MQHCQIMMNSVKNSQRICERVLSKSHDNLFGPLLIFRSPKSTLDTFYNQLKEINKMETSTKSIAINFGLYLGGILSLLTVMAYAISLDLFTKWWFGIAMMILVIVLGVMSSTK